MEPDEQQIVSVSFETSSNIEKIEYDPFMGVLTIKFLNGGTYDYVDVEKSVFNEMQEAPSPGKFFHQNIRGKFEFLKRTR